MSPQIALGLFIIFILYLFRIEYKTNPSSSNALWIPLIWVLLIGSRGVSLWLNPQYTLASQSASDSLEGNSLDRNILLSLIVIGTIILSRRKIIWSQVFRNNIWILLFFSYCLISVSWSEFPLPALKRWFKGFGNLIMILVIFTDPNNPLESLKTVLKKSAYVLIPLSILLCRYFPIYGRSYSIGGELMYTGVTTNKNTLGELCLVCGLFFFWNLFVIWRRRNRYLNKKEVCIHFFFIFMILYLFRLANSATSFMGLIVGICVIIGIGFLARENNAKYIGFYIFCTAIIYILLQVLFDITQIVIASLGRDTTLTGRVDFWKELLETSTNQLVGTGYESYWSGERLAFWWKRYWWLPNQAHNGYLEVYLNLGIIGLLFLTGVLFSSYTKIKRSLNYNFNFAIFRMAFFVIMVLYNITEATFTRLSLTGFVFLLIVVQYPITSNLQVPMSNQLNWK